MLILSRKADESIVIDDQVTITILSVKGKQVRLGINAPPNVSVHREEVYGRDRDGADAVAATREAATTGDDADEELPGDDIGNR